MKVTNIYGVPAPLVTLATAEYYSKGAAQYSVTELMAPPKIKRLQERFDNERVTDVSDLLWSMLGSALHVVMERGTTDGWTSEERLFVELDGVRISGAIDLQQETEDGVIIIDYKMTSAWSVMHDKIEWAQQLNVYKWLVEKVKGKKVVGLRICSLIRDFSRHDKREDYPKAPIHMVDIPMWDHQTTEAYIKERLEMHQNAKVAADLGEEFQPCTDSERWMSEETYAVKREGRKTAIRVFKSIDEATELAEKEKGYVEIRKGEYRRCAGDFCGVSKWCKQYEGEVNVIA
jgi:hypothetical protein